MAQTDGGRVVRGNTKYFSDNVKKSNFRSRNWFLTVNSYTMTQLREISLIPDDTAKLVLVQTELGFKSRLHHFHALIIFKNQRTFDSMKRQYPMAHIEKVKNLTKCREYCLKRYTFTGKRYERVDGVVKTNTLDSPLLDEDQIDWDSGKGVPALRLPCNPQGRGFASLNLADFYIEKYRDDPVFLNMLLEPDHLAGVDQMIENAYDRWMRGI